MIDDGFEWDADKAAVNWRNHGITFDQAAKACRDPFAIEWFDERDNRIRIISVRRAENMSKTTIFAKTRPDGTVVEILPDGSERLFPETPMRPMTEAEIHAAALANPAARPFTDEEFARARLVPRAKTLRRALGLTQEEFSTRFQIPLGTLRDWEQGRAEPDQPARAYLKVIAGDAEAVQRALQSARPRPA